MRKNETPADPARCHICLSLKNRLFPGAGAGAHHVHTKHQEVGEMTDLSLRTPAEGERGFKAASSALARLGWPLSQPLAGRPAIPYPVRLMALGSQAANRSLSGMSHRTDRCVELFPGTWMTPARQGLRRKWLEMWANFCCQHMEPARCFCETASWGSAFSLRWVCTHTE